MSEPLILVTGASGRTGAAVVEQLGASGARVRAAVHRRDARSERLAALGAEVVVADLFDPGQVKAAVAGVSRLYCLPPWHPHALHSAVVVATAARRAGVETVVHLSQWLANPAHPSLLSRQQWLTEQLLEQTFGSAASATHTTIHPGFFADNYLGNGLIGLAAHSSACCPCHSAPPATPHPATKTSPGLQPASCSIPNRTRAAATGPPAPPYSLPTRSPT